MDHPSRGTRSSTCRPARQRPAFVEALETRRLFAWGAAAQLVGQDDVAQAFSNVTGAGVTVAVLDTGVDYTHPKLGGGIGPAFKVVDGYDFVDDDDDPMDTHGHGTAVAGVIAAEPFTVNGTQYRGAAPDADLVALRIAEGGEAISERVIERALQWVIDHRARHDISIVNISFGGGRFSDTYASPTLSDEFRQLGELGVLVVAASGNDGVSFFGGTGVAYPGADANVAAAGSVNDRDVISEFTQRGDELDILAPGEDVITTAPDNQYARVDGTSFASPYVAGAAALLKQAAPRLTGRDLLSALKASGSPNYDGDDEGFVGTGEVFARLQIDDAIALALDRAPVDDLPGDAGGTSDLAYDEEGVLHLAYYDSADRNIKYATRSTSGRWSDVQVVDTTGHQVGAYLSLALDPTGKPAVAYYDATEGDLEFARFDGRDWQRRTLDSKKTVGQHASLAFDAVGDPVVAYYRKTSGDLRVMSFDGATGRWTRFTVAGSDGADVGKHASLAVSDAGRVGVAFANTTSGDLNYAQWNGFGWSLARVADLDGVGTLSLAFDPGNEPAVSYYDAGPTNLGFAYRANGTWFTETLASKGAQGQHSSLFFDDAGRANVASYSRGANAVVLFRGTPGNWDAEVIATGGGRNVAGAGYAGDERAVAYVDTAAGGIRVTRLA